MALAVKALANHSDYFDSMVCVTAQHRQILDQGLDSFETRQNLTMVACSILLGQGLRIILHQQKDPDRIYSPRE